MQNYLHAQARGDLKKCTMSKVKLFYAYPQFFRTWGSKDVSKKAHSVFNQDNVKEHQAGEQIH